MFQEKNIFGMSVLDTFSSINNVPIGNLLPDTITGTIIHARDKLIARKIDLEFGLVLNVKEIVSSSDILIKPANEVLIDGDIDLSFHNIINLDKIISDVEITGNLLLNSRLDVIGDTSFNSNFEVSGNTLLNSRLDVIGDTSFNSNFEVSGNTLLNSRLDIQGDTSLNSKFEVSGNTLLNSRLDVIGDTSFNSNFEVSGNTLLNTRLDVIGDISFNSDFEVKGNTLLNSILTVQGDTFLNSDLEVSGNILLKSRLDIIKDVSFNSNFEVSGNTLFNSRLDVIGDISFNSDFEVSGNTLLNSRLDVIGDTSLNSNFEVSGNTLLNSRLDVIGDTSLNSDFEVEGNTLLNSRLDVIGDTSLNSDFEVSGNTLLKSRLDVIGDTSLNSNFEVSGNTLLNSRLDVIGDTSFNSDFEVSGNTLLNSRLDVIGDTSFNSDFEVSGNTLLNSRLDVQGDTSFNSNFEVSGNTLLNSRLDVSGDVSFNSNLQVYGNIYNNKIIPDEVLTIDGDISINGIITKNGREQIPGQLVKAINDISSNILFNFKHELGDIYYNNLNNLYKKFSNITNSWYPTELGTIAGQPLGLKNLRFDANTNIITIRWDKPLQIATGITSNESYNLPNSSSSDINLKLPESVNRNMIYFPIVNRICMKIYTLDRKGEIMGVHNYPIYYGFTNEDISMSYIDPEANVIYRKGDAIFGEPNSSRNFYVNLDGTNGNPNRNLLENMPDGIKLYKSVPHVINYSDRLIDSNNEFPSLSVNSSPVDSYRVEIWLENNSTINNIEKNIIDVSFNSSTLPTIPNLVQIGLLDNTSTDISLAQSRCNIVLLDPDFVSFGRPNDGLVLFNKIKFEWSLDNITFYEFNKIFDFNINLLEEGMYDINPTRNKDDVIRNYYFEINSDYLGSNYNLITNLDVLNFSIRVSYRNTLNEIFGTTRISNEIIFGKPSKHIITKTILTQNNNITITIPPIISFNKLNNDINNEIILTSTNNNDAIFIKSVQFYIERKLDDNNIELLEDSLTFDYNGNSFNDQDSTYIYNVPNDISSNISYKLRFKVRIKNNILDKWSEWSDIDEDFNDNTDYSITIYKMNNNNNITDFTFSDQNNLFISWNDPDDGDRGTIITKSNSGLPLVYQYNILIYNSSISDISKSIIEINNNNINNINDASNNNIVKIDDFIFNKGMINNDSNSIAINQNLKLEITQRNSYINTFSLLNITDLYYTLTNPNLPTNNNSTFNISNTNLKNNLIIKWHKPTQPGLFYGNNLPDNNLSNLVINQYRISIIADRINSNSPLFRNLSLDDYPSLIDIGIYNINNISNDLPSEDSEALLYITNNNGIINRDDIIKTIQPRNIINDISSVLVYPDTNYTINIIPRNRYMIESLNNLTINLTTNSPNININLLNTSTIPLFNIENSGNLINFNSYLNNGYILNRNNPELTNIELSKIQINNINNININNLFNSTKISHRMNTSNFIQFLPPTTFVENINNYKLRQIRFINKATQDILVKYGNDNLQYIYDISNNGATKNMLSINFYDSKDTYSDNNLFDTHNKGYWWQEDFDYKLDFNNNTTDLLGVPILINLSIRYNNKLNFIEYNDSSFENDNDIVNINKDILFNSINENNYVYFDNLNSYPELDVNNINNNINNNIISEISNTNNINGIPNLYNMGIINNVDCSYIYHLNYKLLNYSEYYALDKSINFTSIVLINNNDISNILVDNIITRSWTNKNNSQRFLNYWEITNLELNNNNINTPDISNSLQDVRIAIKASNTLINDKLLLIPENQPLFKFILDKNTAEYFKNIYPSLLEIPNDFLPDYNIENTTGTSNIMPTSYTSYGNKNNINIKQLSLFEGKFYSNKAWSNITQININNANLYNINTNNPVFTHNNNYSWTIFKYQYISTGTFNFNKIAIALLDSNISNSDFKNNSVQIFISLGSNYNIIGSDNNNYYWFNISKSSTWTDLNSNQSQIVYAGNLGDIKLDTMTDEEFNNGNIINNNNGFIFTNPIIPKLLGGRINVKSLNINDTQDIYVAVSIINNNENLYLNRPNVYLINNINNSIIKQVNPFNN